MSVLLKNRLPGGTGLLLLPGLRRMTIRASGNINVFVDGRLRR